MRRPAMSNGVVRAAAATGEMTGGRRRGPDSPQRGRALSRLAGALILLLSVCLAGVVFAAVTAQEPEPTAAAVTKNHNHDHKITMDFQDADVRAVIKFMSELTGNNYLIDNRVKGTVTIITPSEVTVAEAQQIFESILEVQGYAVVPAGPVSKIVPVLDAKQKAGEVRVDEADLPEDRDALVSQLIRLKYVSAAQLVPVLRPLISSNSYLASHDPSNTLVLTDVASNVRRIVEIIQRLDVPERAESLQLFTLKNASANAVARLLSGLFAPSEKQESSVRFLPDERTNSLLVLSDATLLPRVKAIIRSLDRAPDRQSDYIHVYYLQNAEAEEMAKVLADMVERMKGAAQESETSVVQGFVRPVSIMADKATNSLVIGADPQDYETLRNVIEKLDIRRLQVFVEALLMEVASDVTRDFGIEWRFTGDFTQGGKKPFGGTNFGNINTAATDPERLGPGLAVGVVDGVINFRGQSFLNIGALVTALQRDSAINILATPNLLTTDNEEAEILVGQNVPFVTGQLSTQAGVANPFQTIERQDVGIILRITPQISEGQFIRLNIYQEISRVDDATFTGTTNASDIITSKRAVSTTAVVREGQMVALGGLLRDDTLDDVSKVPVLGDLPMLGALFRSTGKTRVKTNLMIFLRPVVVRDPSQIETLSREKYHLMTNELPGELFQNRHLTPPQEAPRAAVPAASLAPAVPPHSETARGVPAVPAPRSQSQRTVAAAPKAASQPKGDMQKPWAEENPAFWEDSAW